MSSARRDRKLQRAADERAYREFGRSFAPKADTLDPLCHIVLRKGLQVALEATHAPQGQRFRAFLRSLPEPIPALLTSLGSAMADHPDEHPDLLPFFPLLLIFTEWARMLVHGTPERNWYAPLTEDLGITGIRLLIECASLEGARRGSGLETLDYPEDLWSPHAEEQVERARVVVLDALREKMALEGDEFPEVDTAPALPRRPLPHGGALPFQVIRG